MNRKPRTDDQKASARAKSLRNWSSPGYRARVARGIAAANIRRYRGKPRVIAGGKP